MNAGTSRTQRVSVPPKKDLAEKKQPLSVTIEPGHRTWLREHYGELGFRSESHAVDAAITLLMETRGYEKSKPARP